MQMLPKIAPRITGSILRALMQGDHHSEQSALLAAVRFWHSSGIYNQQRKSCGG